MNRYLSIGLIIVGAAASALLCACSLDDMVSTKTTPQMQARGAPPTVKLSEAATAQSQFEKAVKKEGEDVTADVEAATADAQAEVESITAEANAKIKAVNDRLGKTRAAATKKLSGLSQDLADSTSIFKAGMDAAAAKVANFTGAIQALANPSVLATVGLPVGGISLVTGLIGLFTKKPGTDADTAKEKRDSYNAGQQTAINLLNQARATQGLPPIVLTPSTAQAA